MEVSAESIIVSVLVFFAVVCAVWAVSVTFQDGKQTTANREQEDGVPVLYRVFMPGIAVFAAAFGKFMQRLAGEGEQRLKDLIRRGGLSLETIEVYGAQCFFCVMFALLGAVAGFFLPASFPKAIRIVPFFLLAVVGFVLPRVIVDRAAEEREDEVIRHLPFALDILASSMRAGLDFNSALRYLIALDGKNVLHREFAVYLQETELGKSRTEALQAMDRRLNVPAFSRFVTAVAFGMERGSSIIELMLIQAEEMRVYRQNRAEKAAAKAPGKMLFPTLFFIVPAVFIVILFPPLYKAWESGMFTRFGFGR